MKRKLFSLFLVIIIGIIGAFAFTACDGGSDKNGGDKPDMLPDYLTLDKTDISLEPGETVTVTATLSDELTGKTVIWKSLAPTIATVEDGKVTAKRVGNATIMVIAGVETAWCRVTVSKDTTLKDLRCDPSYYEDRQVTVEGIITAQFNHSVYIEDYDEETGCYFGMEVYYGFNASGILLEQLKIGNEVRVCGTFSQFQNHYRISGISYNEYKPDLPTNTIVLSNGHEGAFVETSAKDIVSGKRDIKFYDETLTLDYGDAVSATTVTVSNLKVLRTVTTNDFYGDYGAMKLECQAEDGTVIVVKTEILKDAYGNVIIADTYEDKTITVKGIVEKYLDYDSFNETSVEAYGIRCHLADYITIL